MKRIIPGDLVMPEHSELMLPLLSYPLEPSSVKELTSTWWEDAVPAIVVATLPEQLTVLVVTCRGEMGWYHDVGRLVKVD